MSFLRRIGQFIIWCFALGLIGTIGFFILVWFFFLPQLPDVASLRDFHLQTPLQVYTNDAKLITEFGEQRRIPLRIEEVPQDYINALLAAEDENFYQHYGVDPKALLRAAVRMIQAGGEIQGGGSTITMQVARNYLLTLEKTFSRKFNEILLSFQIEHELEKHQILAMYINKMFMGHRAYGVEAASQVYYGRHIWQLTLAEQAMMAGLFKAPSKYNPLTNRARAKVRRDWILGRMLLLGFIDNDRYQEAVTAPVTARFHSLTPETQASYVGEMVRQELLEKFPIKDVYTSGYRVYTTIDSRLQDAAQDAVQQGLLAYDRRHGFRGNYANTGVGLSDDEAERKLNRRPSLGPLEPAYVREIDTLEQTAQVLIRYGEKLTIRFSDMTWMKPRLSINRLGQAPEAITDLISVGDLVYVQQITNKDSQESRWVLSQVPDVQGALVALNPNNGAIISLVGGYEYVHSKFNRATQALRQPGSNFKPFIYSAALENGYTAATTINDAPVVFNDISLEGAWRPENYSGKFYGPTRLREGLYKSRNLVSIRILRDIGVRTTVKYASKLGFNKAQLANNLSLALGSASLFPIDIAAGYAAIANTGYRIYPYFIDRIEDDKGNIIYQAKPTTVCPKCEKADAELAVLEPHTDTEEITALLGTETELIGLDDDNNTNTLPVAERVMDPRVNYIVHTILQDVIKKGTGRRALALKRADLAGKTGTTNDQKDAWFSGYNGNIVATTWIGFDQPEPLGRNEFGSTAALPMWIDFMTQALKGTAETKRATPNGLVEVRIDKKTGLLAKGKDNSMFEIFREEYVPTEVWSSYQGINQNTKQNAATSDDAKVAPESVF